MNVLCTSSVDIIGAMKPLSYFQLTSLSDPIARTADSREWRGIVYSGRFSSILISCKSSYAGDLLEKMLQQ